MILEEMPEEGMRKDAATPRSRSG